MKGMTQGLLGIFLGLGLLAVTLLFGSGSFFICLPIFFTAYLSFSFPVAGACFTSVYILGLAVGRLAFGQYPQIWVVPEALALAALYWSPAFIKANQEGLRERVQSQYGLKKKEYEAFREVAERLKKENSQNEKQLRHIEHLYDVIKEAGSTMNVQEMIELTKEFTERMFDLPHFIIAVISNDAKKYEVRIASGCDESIFRSFEVDLESGGLAGILSREKKPVWISNTDSEGAFSKLRNLSIRSFIFLPFLVQDRVIGFLCSFSDREDFIDQEKFSNFQVFCNQISIGLQKSLLYEKVQKLSITDGLTKLYSHRHFKQRLEEELVLANRYSSNLSLLIMDIDYFKRYNDNYGHVAGDHVLMEVAKILREQSDMTHLVARYGGEEMVVVAPETTKEQAMELAEKIRRTVETHSFAVGKETTKVTVSIGVATFPQDAESSLDLISKSDKALYAAKGRGRNCIVAYAL